MSFRVVLRLYKATGPGCLAAKIHSKVLTKHMALGHGRVIHCQWQRSAHLSSGTVTPPQRIQLKAFINTREWCVYKLFEA